MITESMAPAPASTRARAILHHPDQTSAWSVVVAASLEVPLSSARLTARLDALAETLPIVGARLRDDCWVPGHGPQVVVVNHDPVSSQVLGHPYMLAAEPPLRVLVRRDGRRLAVAGHHAAFDGLALVTIVGALLGERLPRPAADAPARTGGRRLAGLPGRLLRPADRIAPSRPEPAVECLVSSHAVAVPPNFTARLADAAVRAVSARNSRFCWGWRRIGLSIGIGGPAGVGNGASYRRVDLEARSDVPAAVAAALRDPEEPVELRRAPKAARWLRPLAHRLSDSLLVSNVGCHNIARASRLEFFPVARGRSAVAIGAAGLAPGIAVVTLRARWLSRPDAEALLADIVDLL